MQGVQAGFIICRYQFINRLKNIFNHCSVTFPSHLPCLPVRRHRRATRLQTPRMRICFTILFSWLCLTANCQQPTTAGMKEIPGKSLHRDTTRLNLLLKLAFDNSRTNPDTGLIISDTAIALARFLNRPLNLADAFVCQGLNLVTLGEDSLAMLVYNRALEILEHFPDQDRYARTLHNLGVANFEMADYPKALDNQRKALTIFQKIRNLKGQAGAFNSIGIIYQYLADYPAAIDNYLKSLGLYEQVGDNPDRAFPLGNLGIVYSRLHNYHKALEYYRQALTIYEHSGDLKGMGSILDNMGTSYDYLDSSGKALVYYQKALTINRRIKNRSLIASDLLNIAVVYSDDLSEYGKALDYFNPAIRLYRELENKIGLLVCYDELAGLCANAPDAVLQKQGIPPQDRFAKAIAYQNTSIRLASETGELFRQSESWKDLGKIYEKQGNYKNALAAFKKYVRLRDSLFNDTKKTEITRKEIQFSFDKKEALLKAENDKKQALAAADIHRQQIIRKSVITGTLILILTGILVFIFYKRRRDAEEQKRDAELKALISDTEMKALRAQMNPHFIFNSLNSISDYIAGHDMKSADYYLTKFAKLIRLILENSEHREVTLASDLQALELYIQLEALRLNNRFSYRIEVEDAIDINNTLVPPMLLQPFVENSIWHGLSRKTGKGKILIQIKKEGDMLHCIVEDDGVGREKSKTFKSELLDLEKKSLGMKITTARIDIINKIKRSRATLSLTDLEEGMRAEVSLPLVSNF